ncbi:MAG: glutamyl-tRNA reductase [Candidatus Promineifilaceae bacterium]
MIFAPIVCLGLNHRTASVALREQLACALADAQLFLPQFPTIAELVVVSTCNRLELYALVHDAPAAAQQTLTQLLAAMGGMDAGILTPHLYMHAGLAAANHLCRVAAGLDSLVLGESQILGQVAAAYQAAISQGTIGPGLDSLFRAAIYAGKRSRSQTAISNNPASISSMAIALVQEIIPDLAECHFLIIGLGEMGKLALKSLQARGLRHISLLNRNRQRAEMLAQTCGCRAFGLEELPQALSQADVVISATAAPHVIISRDLLALLVSQEPARRRVLIDLAVPRDIDPASRDLPGVHLYDLDALRASLDSALAARHREVPLVEAIIAQEVAAWEAEWQKLAIRPVISDLRQKAEAIRQQELSRTLRRLGEVDPRMVAHLHHLSRAIVNKILHEPTIRLKQSAADGQADEYIAAVRDLFGLVDPDLEYP